MNSNDMSNVVNYEKIGHRIQKHRKEKGLSQDQLSEQIGISLSFMGVLSDIKKLMNQSNLLNIVR